MKSMAKTVKPMEVKCENKPRKIYPSTSFSSKTLPDVADLRTKDKFKVISEYRVTGSREGWDDKSEIVVESEMLSCEIVEMPEDMKEAKNRNLSRKDWEEIKAKGKKSA